MSFCSSGKDKLDKKGAVSLKNLTKKLHNIDMKVYECHECGYWHLASVGEHRQFRHAVYQRKRTRH